VIGRDYFDRLFPWVLIRQVDKTQGKIGQKRPSNSAKFLHFESASVYTPSGSNAPKKTDLKPLDRIFSSSPILNLILASIKNAI
ncbi:MAG: hypothetical protein AAF443_07320, partial [Chlamydiota bacterium]